MGTAMRGLGLAAVLAGGCVFGSRPILPNDPDPTMVIDSGLAGGGGGADAASRADVGIPATGTDSAVPPPQDAAQGLDASAPAPDATAEDDAAAPMDTAPLADIPAGGADAATDAPRDAAVDGADGAADAPDGDAPDAETPDGGAPPADRPDAPDGAVAVDAAGGGPDV